jgi:hypothetical protein
VGDTGISTYLLLYKTIIMILPIQHALRPAGHPDLWYQHRAGNINERVDADSRMPPSGRNEISWAGP